MIDTEEAVKQRRRDEAHEQNERRWHGSESLMQAIMGSGLQARRTPWEPLIIPAHPPTNVCIECVRKAILYWSAAKASRVQQHRAIACPHTSKDGSRLSVAFICKSPARWLELSEIAPADLNLLYFELVLRNGRPRESQVSMIKTPGIEELRAVLRLDTYTDTIRVTTRI